MLDTVLQISLQILGDITHSGSVTVLSQLPRLLPLV